MVQAATLADVHALDGAPPALRVVAVPAGSGAEQPAAPLAGTRPRLEIPTYASPEALALQRELGVGHVLAQILVRRGFSDPQEARRFLSAAECHDPAAFTGIATALEVIRRQIDAGGRIVVHGDYDVDGVCATAII